VRLSKNEFYFVEQVLHVLTRTRYCSQPWVFLILMFNLSYLTYAWFVPFTGLRSTRSATGGGLIIGLGIILNSIQ
jgi:hypothetical protein